MEPWNDFIPGSLARKISRHVYFRPIRSWHSLTYAGEGLFEVNGDRSGCLHKGASHLQECTRPYTVTHRCYWHDGNGNRLSAFLSYPNGMGVCPDYFWEIYPVAGDIERFDSEAAMEKRIVQLLNSRNGKVLARRLENV